MSERTYNGWTNYETWNVKLWIDNEEGSYNYWRERSQEAWDKAKGEDLKERTLEAERTIELALKDEFEEAEADLLKRAGCEASVWADLLGTALSEVNWREIADSMIETVDKDTQ